jgi:hypothetical protein
MNKVYLTINIRLTHSRYTADPLQEIEICNEGELEALHSMCYGLGEAIVNGASKLCSMEIVARKEAE